jgi:dienelactone hydrolase
MKKLITFICLVLAVAFAPHAVAGTPWNIKQLADPPRVYDAPGFHEPGMRALFFEGLPWQGKATRVFAWYGVPTNRSTGKVPAVVLVHGGGGTAYADWVRRWNERGYAAIAIDTCGSVPNVDPSKRTSNSLPPLSTRDENGGPAGWDASFDQVEWPVKDQWTYHAVADIALADSLLRSFAEVDANRIGIIGVSWGAYLTTIAASIDPRFRFVVPVYGCGFLGEDSFWLPAFEKMGFEKSRKWLKLWDPSVYLSRAKMPFLWVDGTNDFAYPFDSLQKSYRLPRGPRTLSFHLRMEHSPPAGERPEEIYAFADQHMKSGTPLANVSSIALNGRSAQIRYKSAVPLAKAELLYTRNEGAWKDRLWQVVPAEILEGKDTIRAIVPDGTRVCFFNLIDNRGLIVSSDYQEF